MRKCVIGKTTKFCVIALGSGFCLKIGEIVIIENTKSKDSLRTVLRDGIESKLEILDECRGRWLTHADASWKVMDTSYVHDNNIGVPFGVDALRIPFTPSEKTAGIEVQLRLL